MGGGSSRPDSVDEQLTGAVPGAAGDSNNDDATISQALMDAHNVDRNSTNDVTDYVDATSGTSEETAKWIFELIPYYDADNPDAVATLHDVVMNGVHVDARDDFGNTLLMMATHHKKIQLVQWALQQGADINAINDAGVCALHIACHESSGSCAIAECLLQHGADTELVDTNHCTVLHYAGSAGDSELVTLLIMGGANCYAVDANGFTAVDYALESGSEDCAALLLDAATAQQGEEEEEKMWRWPAGRMGIIIIRKPERLARLWRQSLLKKMVGIGRSILIQSPGCHTTIIRLPWRLHGKLRHRTRSQRSPLSWAMRHTT